jgi:hypothetical protein
MYGCARRICSSATSSERGKNTAIWQVKTQKTKSCTDSDDMNRYAIQQNDVGVNCFVTVGDVDAALHHFRQALSAEKLLLGRLSSDSTVPSLHFFAPPEADGTNLDSTVPDQRNLTPVPADTGISHHFEPNRNNAKGTVRDTQLDDGYMVVAFHF